MAADKLVDSSKLEGALTATADAIRAKTGSADKIVWNSETGFASVIEAITGGGSSDEWEILMPATDVTFDGGEYISFESVYPLELGKTYRVIWNGEEFICETEQITFNGMPCIAMGNTGMLTGEAGEHPFLIGYIPDASGFGIFTTDMTSDTHNVTIYKEKTAIIEGAHVVTFVLEDGSTYTKPVMNGDTCGDPVALGLFSTPTKESTAQYEYTFNGWATTVGGEADENALVNVTEDRMVYVAFKSDVRYYTINFYDGDDIVHTEICEYGTTPNYIPTKDGYVFLGWTPSITSVTGDANYYAQFDETMLASGSCGDNATWALTGNGTLSVVGTDAIGDYKDETTQPWYEYRDNIQSIIIGEGITVVGENAFRNCKAAESLTLPNTLVEIKRYGFGSCEGLTGVTLPNSLTTIGTYAFRYCIGLTEITIPKNLTNGGSGFSDCTGLVSATVLSSSLGGSMFENCSNLSNVVLTEGLTAIWGAAFRNCTSLVRVVIPASVVEIKTNAFTGCTNLDRAYFTVTSGWKATPLSGGQSVQLTTLGNTTAAKERDAAKWLRETYVIYTWTRS